MFRGKLLIVSSVLILVLKLSHGAEETIDQAGHTQDTLDPIDVYAINTVAETLRLKWESDEREFTSKSCGSSKKVICSCNKHTLCRVTIIDFSDMHLRGEIPAAIGNLTSLLSLDLRSNRIRGNIPNSLSNLTQLQYLDLSSNDLDGPIPDFFGQMKSLTFLDLAQNQLSEEISASLGNISSLEHLHLSDNQLTGTLPESLGNLQNVHRMVLANNKFQGQLPRSFANLTNLRHFNVRGNEFIGPIPEYIGHWNQLQVLILQGNHFEGPLPNTISSLEMVTEMHIADLYGRSGELFPFPEISRMTQLNTLVLRNCSINGSIPSYLGGFQALSHLDLSFNKLTGEVPDFSEYGNLSNIFLRANKLTGPIPKWPTNKTEANLDFSENNFTYSSIADYIANRNVNSFACCSSSADLDTALLQNNNFSCGEDPLKNDRLYINCGGEKVTAVGGTFESDVTPEGASTFYISDDNKWGYSSMGIYNPEQTKTMSYAKSIESHEDCGFESIQNKEVLLYKTARVAPISLKYFGFCMKNGWYRVKLDFAEITYKEAADHKSRGNRLFDVLIQGTKVLADFNIKEVAGGRNRNVSKTFQAEVKGNNLEIHLYWAGKGSKRGAFEFYGPLVSAISVEPVVKPVKPSKKVSPLSIAGISGSIVLFLVLIFICLWKMGYLRGKESKIEEHKELMSLPGGGLFTYKQLKVATQNFSNENKIGEGGFGAVFKGVLTNGTTVAVKQLSAKSKQGSREFANEVGVISALQHPNLVKLLGCCIDENQLLLVYEYMENNSLAHALFGPEELRVQLNWMIRSKICRGIAKGLAFLHEESKLKIIHRDIKTTNILLDKDFVAKISDFGFAKLHEGHQTHIITKIAGTTGQNSASYRPNDESVYLLDLAYVLQGKGDLLSLVDPILGSEYAAKEAKMILELAMLCTNPSPTLRPRMSEVVKILKGKTRLNYTPSLAPYSADGFARAKAMASRSFSNYSRSMSREEPSNPASYEFSIKEEEVHISADYTPGITDETGRSPLSNV
ncbi:hypothetical protein V6N11_005417 [Hibiscus sabdariffa]|uniref:non-specific serine/threonine protein kinase n=1 Tax=Hibiscus sabdariffa TaxID=183260 RepID=A0ABR2RN93_9ROSI